MKPSSCLLFIPISLLFLSLPPSLLSDPRISQAGLFCGTSKAPLSSHYIPIFVQEMQSLSQTITTQDWASHSLNFSSLPIFGFVQCFHDLSHTDCLLCYAASRTKLPRCLPSLSARIYLDGCFLRYDNYSFFSEAIDPVRDTLNCSSRYGVAEDEGGERREFEKNVGEAVDNVVDVSVGEGFGFGVGQAGGVYALAQCWKTLRSDECGICLRKAAREVRECFPNLEGRALNAGCYLRYSTHKFYNQAGQEEKDQKSSFRKGAITATVLSVAAVAMLFLSAFYVIFSRLSKMKKGSKHVGQISISINKSSLNFKYETLEKATDYFNPSRKIGQGGAGSVFKGTLPNGNVVAVKRLVYNTRQWVDEFFNEVNLITGIDHKNLVKLLGCSIEGPESLLVYEYLPNKSLDQFIFEKNKSQILNWKQRFDIIIGIAEGLAYLHAGSKVRIIHRDIKSSNILLDENLTPKIADFGLARCFAADKTHLSTGIAGTLGYMAPEYLVRGQLTEKADVYSYGVLVLEILCGRRNNVFREDSGSLLQTVWNLYRSNRLHEAVDPCLGDDFPAAELSRVLQIGLLCTQASASLRPTMEEVVVLLSNSDVDVCVPNRPPFLSTGAGLLNSQSSIRSYSTNSFVSNALKKIGMSEVSSSETFSTRSSEGPSRSEELINQA
ncbi:hypothetical protein QN277_013763 [Acacia crassicarpa]|uniref:Cysteine-rich receptor-like protein kinase 42 n=1 Tax=Acacia crassicarpa TaxID=499986 RepID=A0AAE1TG45_9FABA|nr:hypothetical protein QN277_013763 [Acacia crassicarpa]